MTEATGDSLGQHPPLGIQQLATPLSTWRPASSGARTTVESPVNSVARNNQTQ